MNDNDGWHRPTSRRTHVDARVRAPQRDSRAVHRVVRDDQSRARHGLARALAVHRDRPLAARHERVDSSAHGTRDARDGGGRAFSAMTMSRRSRRRARRLNCKIRRWIDAISPFAPRSRGFASTALGVLSVRRRRLGSATMLAPLAPRDAHPPWFLALLVLLNVVDAFHLNIVWPMLPFAVRDFGVAEIDVAQAVRQPRERELFVD